MLKITGKLRFLFSLIELTLVKKGYWQEIVIRQRRCHDIKVPFDLQNGKYSFRVP